MRKHNGGIKMHTFYDVEAQVPAFVHITEAKVHESKSMPKIPHEKRTHYIFDHGYNDFGNLYSKKRIKEFFVIRAKTNLRIKPETWKQKIPENVVSDAIGYFTVYKSSKIYQSMDSKETSVFHTYNAETDVIALDDTTEKAELYNVKDNLCVTCMTGETINTQAPLIGVYVLKRQSFFR